VKQERKQERLQENKQGKDICKERKGEIGKEEQKNA
jgi:hypothetical protein